MVALQILLEQRRGVARLAREHLALPAVQARELAALVLGCAVEQLAVAARRLGVRAGLQVALAREEQRLEIERLRVALGEDLLQRRQTALALALPEPRERRAVQRRRAVLALHAAEALARARRVGGDRGFAEVQVRFAGAVGVLADLRDACERG